MSYPLLVISIFLSVLLSCNRNPQLVATGEANKGVSVDVPERPPKFERENPKLPDPKKQEKCGKDSPKRDLCDKEKTCKKICDDIFNRISDKKACYKLPEKLVLDFEQLLEDTEDGEINKIANSTSTLDCLLDLDEEDFVDAVGDMNQSEAKEFLVKIAEDVDLADILKDEDDAFNIIKTLLFTASRSNDLIKQLSVEIERDKTFLWLLSEVRNKEAWKWLEAYIEDRNENNNKENIELYCQALLTMSDSDLKSFLVDASLFEDRYRDDVEDEDDKYLYDIDNSPDDEYEGDFKDWCEAKIPTPCPADGTEPASTNRLTRITFAPYSYPSNYYSFKYRQSSFCDASSDTSNTQFGSSNPAQNIILQLNSYRRLVLNKGAISEIKDYNISDNTYYLYIDSHRYQLDSTVGTYTPYAETAGCAGNPKNLLLFQNGNLTALKTGTKSLGYTGATAPTGSQLQRDVYLASEQDGDCTFYK